MLTLDYSNTASGGNPPAARVEVKKACSRVGSLEPAPLSRIVWPCFGIEQLWLSYDSSGAFSPGIRKAAK